MMAKKAFQLGDTLAEVLGKVSGPDTEQITQIELPLIDPAAENFYSMDGVEELAANIELVGLLDPLRVRENPEMPGRYLIVSGHRRRAALWMLYEEAPEKWGRVSCIVEPTAASPELQELRLIYANADTRRMNSADLSRQAERVEELLYKLKEQGVEFPGRMRDHVAEACKVSATKLAELKVIRDKLIPAWRPDWESGKLAQATAYEIARQPAEAQEKLRRLIGDRAEVPEWKAKKVAAKIEKAAKLTCPSFGGPCGHADERLRVEICESGWRSCTSYQCCRGCGNYLDCKFVCPSLREARDADKRKKRDERKEQIAEEKKETARTIAGIDAAWQRYTAARKAKGLGVREAREACGKTWYQWQDEKKEEAAETGTHKVYDRLPYGISLSEAETLARTADALGCSIDYLLGRTDELQPASGPQQFRSGEPAEKTLAWCVFEISGQPVTTSAVWWPHLKKWCFEHGAGIDAECVGWIPLPDYKGVLRDV